MSKKISWIAVGFLLKAIQWTSHKLMIRMTVLGEEEYLKIRREKKPVILLLWHRRICILPYFFRKRGVMILISPSDDGELAAQILAGWGFRIIRGSSSHPVIQVWRRLKEELQQGGEVLLVADGPRGPSRELKPGCIRLAKESDAYLIPFTFSASKKKVFPSWDRFVFYFPFSRVVALYGKPFMVHPDLDKDSQERMRLSVENYMQRLDEEIETII